MCCPDFFGASTALTPQSFICSADTIQMPDEQKQTQ